MISASHPTAEAHCLLAKGCNPGPHQFRTRNNLIGTQQMRSRANNNTEKSTKLLDFLSLITVWFLVRVQAGPPMFARDSCTLSRLASSSTNKNQRYLFRGWPGCDDIGCPSQMIRVMVAVGLRRNVRMRPGWMARCRFLQSAASRR
jgi:hypothetical protein